MKMLERSLLGGYIAAVSIAILFAPQYPNFLLRQAQPIVEIVPAVARLIELSEIPGKTVAWAVSSVLFSPLVLLFAVMRFTRIRDDARSVIDILKVRNGLLILCLIMLPWPLFNWYREGMKRGGSWISAMGASEAWLVVFGATISLSYTVVFFSAVVVTVRTLLIRHSKT